MQVLRILKIIELLLPLGPMDAIQFYTQKTEIVICFATDVSQIMRSCKTYSL